jgi:hypothetical protein
MIDHLVEYFNLNDYYFMVNKLIMMINYIKYVYIDYFFNHRNFINYLFIYLYLIDD